MKTRQCSILGNRNPRRTLIPVVVASMIALGACSDPDQGLPAIEGLTEAEVAELKELAQVGDCTELAAAREFFEIGFNIGALTTTAAVSYAEDLLREADC